MDLVAFGYWAIVLFPYKDVFHYSPAASSESNVTFLVGL